MLQIASQVANALENARLMERLETRPPAGATPYRPARDADGLTLLPRARSPRSRSPACFSDGIVAALEADGGFVVRDARHGFEVVASHHLPESMQASSSRGRRRRSRSGGGSSRPNTAALSRNASPTSPGSERMIAAGITAQAVFPVREGDRLVGAFVCFFSSAGEERVAADDRNVEAVGRIISIAYANVRMSDGLAEAAEHERRLTAELQALQELTLLAPRPTTCLAWPRRRSRRSCWPPGRPAGATSWSTPSRPGWTRWRGWDCRVRTGRMRASRRDPGRLAALRAASSPTKGSGFRGLRRAAARRLAVAQAVLPLRVDDRLAGVLHLEWSETPRTEQYDVHFLEPIARICSISLANFRLRSELVHRAAAQRALGHRLDTLDELTRIGEEASSFEELAHRTVSLVREALGASGVCYLLIEPGHHFETHAVAGETGAFRLWLKGVPAKDAPGGSLLLSGGGSVLGDFVASQVNERVLPLARATGFRSFGAIPIRTGEELAGALLCFFEQPAATLPSTSPPWTPWPGSPASPWPTTACANGWSRPRSATERCSRSHRTPCSYRLSTGRCSTPTRRPFGCIGSTAAKCSAATSVS